MQLSGMIEKSPEYRDYGRAGKGRRAAIFQRSLAIVCYVFLAFHSTAPWKCSTLVAVLGSFGFAL